MSGESPLRLSESSSPDGSSSCLCEPCSFQDLLTQLLRPLTHFCDDFRTPATNPPSARCRAVPPCRSCSFFPSSSSPSPSFARSSLAIRFLCAPPSTAGLPVPPPPLSPGSPSTPYGAGPGAAGEGRVVNGSNVRTGAGGFPLSIVLGFSRLRARPPRRVDDVIAPSRAGCVVNASLRRPSFCLLLWGV